MLRLVDHIEKLLPFLTIADAGSFSQAARILKVSQPSLTKTVQQLEAVVDQPLFLRLSRGVRLTEAGETLKRLAERVVKDSSAVEEAIRHPGGLPVGSLALATYTPLAGALYPRVVEFIDRAAPGLHATMRTHQTTAMLLAWVAAREIDVAFVVAGVREPGFVEHVFEDVAFGFYVGRTWRGALPATRSELQRARLVYMGSTFAGASRTLTDVMLEADLHAAALVVDSHEIARGFALRSAGVAVLPDILAAPYVKAGALRRLKVRGAWATRLGEHRIAAVVRADEAERRAIRFLLARFVGA